MNAFWVEWNIFWSLSFFSANVHKWIVEKYRLRIYSDHDNAEVIFISTIRTLICKSRCNCSILNSPFIPLQEIFMKNCCSFWIFKLHCLFNIQFDCTDADLYCILLYNNICFYSSLASSLNTRMSSYLTATTKKKHVNFKIKMY